MFTEMQKEALSELLVLSYGSIQADLETLLGREVTLELPKWQLYERTNPAAIFDNFEDRIVTVEQRFYGQFEGRGLFFINRSVGKQLAEELLGSTSSEPGMSDENRDLLKEIANVVINGMVGTIGNYLNDEHRFMLPQLRTAQLEDLVGWKLFEPVSFPLLMVNAPLSLKDVAINSMSVGLIFEHRSVQALIDLLVKKYPAYKAG